MPQDKEGGSDMPTLLSETERQTAFGKPQTKGDLWTLFNCAFMLIHGRKCKKIMSKPPRKWKHDNKWNTKLAWQDTEELKTSHPCIWVSYLMPSSV